jgi:hypothetical protein
MTVKSTRLALLSDAEQDALYGCQRRSEYVGRLAV